MKNDLFNQRYRIQSNRLQGWDYSRAGLYFVTICTKDHMCLFGDISNGEIRLSAVGEIVADEWQKTERIRPNVKLDESVIMLNHIHGIIQILSDPTPADVDTGHCPTSGDDVAVETPRRGAHKETPHRGVSTDGLQPSYWWKPNSLGSIIGQFKSVCTKRIRKMRYRDFAWQPRFYDRIIRNHDPEFNKEVQHLG